MKGKINGPNAKARLTPKEKQQKPEVYKSDKSAFIYRTITTCM